MKFKYVNAICVIVSSIFFITAIHEGNIVLGLCQAAAIVINAGAYWMLDKQDKQMAELKLLEAELKEANAAFVARIN